MLRKAVTADTFSDGASFRLLPAAGQAKAAKLLFYRSFCLKIRIGRIFLNRP
jgi:hypothetical protein